MHLTHSQTLGLSRKRQNSLKTTVVEICLWLPYLPFANHAIFS